MRIKDILALQILDSRGNPTVKVFVKLDDNSMHTASVPSGASTGAHEAVELRDNNLKFYNGLGVQKAIENIEKKIAPVLVGQKIDDLDFLEKKLLDLDDTKNKSKLGANSILGVSMAISRALSYSQKMPLWKFLNSHFFSDTKTNPEFPRLMVNVVNGGKHANWNFDIQEFMIMPTVKTPSESIRVASEIFHSLGKKLKSSGLSTLVGDEGGYSPMLSDNYEVFQFIVESAENIGYKNSVDFNMAVDCAATEFYENNKYVLRKTKQIKDSESLMKEYLKLQKTFNITSFEDPFAEDDWEAFKKFTKLGKDYNFQVVGDDLFVTNPKRIEQGVKTGAGNSVLIKLNQIGSVSETIEAINLAKRAGFTVAVSHRSGETDDSFIADLAYACGADFIKTGSMCRSERLSKYNRLLEIEKAL